MIPQRLATIPKGRREAFVVELRPFHGKPMVEVRLHRSGGRGMAPTASGIVVRPDLLAALAEVLLAAKAAVEAEGLIPDAGGAS
ncbi:hypothetical protein M446_1226 [Methylobacterium sp. 4-46]|nr:hypothetical protein M446_1226 [Methylobacterium sp. 4-46]